MKNEKCIKCDLFKFLENYIKGFKNYSQKFNKSLKIHLEFLKIYA